MVSTLSRFSLLFTGIQLHRLTSPAGRHCGWLEAFWDPVFSNLYPSWVQNPLVLQTLCFIFIHLQTFTLGSRPVKLQPSAVGHWRDLGWVSLKEASLVVAERGRAEVSWFLRLDFSSCVGAEKSSSNTVFNFNHLPPQNVNAIHYCGYDTLLLSHRSDKLQQYLSKLH